MMRFDASDNLLLLATCIGLYISYYTIRNTLQDVRDAIRVPDPVPTQPKPRQLDPNAEDSINEKTLRTLSKSPNYEVRNAAIKIFIARATRPDTRKHLLRDLRSTDYERRDHAISGLWLILYGVDMNDIEGNSKRRQDFQNREAYESIVRALVNVLPEHGRVANGKDVGRWALEVPPSPVRPIRRPPHELSLLIMLTFLMGSAQNIFNDKGDRLDPVGVALEAGVVTKWLDKYPFPCAMPEYGNGNFKKSDVVTLFEDNAYAPDDNLMGGFMTLLTRSPRGMKELRKAGLTTNTFREDVKSIRRRRSWERLDDETDVLMAGGEDTAGIPTWRNVDATRGGTRLRSSERSQEENRLRRRHREAIVVADQGEPLSRENILQRQDSETGMASVVFLNDDEPEERQSHMPSSDDSMPPLEEMQHEPIDQTLSESPQSFRRRVSERLRQGFRGYPAAQPDLPGDRSNITESDIEAFEDGWDFNTESSSYDVPD